MNTKADEERRGSEVMPSEAPHTGASATPGAVAEGDAAAPAFDPVHSSLIADDPGAFAGYWVPLEEAEARLRALEQAHERLAVLLVDVERHCPCGARPESPATHPHVIGCPVAEAVALLASLPAPEVKPHE